MSFRDPTDIAAQAAEGDQARALAAEARRRELEDLRWLMAHKQGRRVLLRMFEQTGVWRSSFNHSGSVMAFAEGRRDIGLWLTSECVDASHDDYLKMLREHRSK